MSDVSLEVSPPQQQLRTYTLGGVSRRGRPRIQKDDRLESERKQKHAEACRRLRQIELPYKQMVALPLEFCILRLIELKTGDILEWENVPSYLTYEANESDLKPPLTTY